MTLNHKHTLKLIYHLYVIPHTHTHTPIKVLSWNMIYIIMIMTVIIMSTVITLIINSNDTIISLSAGMLGNLLCKLITVSDCPGMVPVHSSKVRKLLFLSSRGSHTYLILPLIIILNLVNDSESPHSLLRNLLVCVCTTQNQ